MPFQPINFAGIAPQGSPGLRDLVSALSKGMSVGVQPQMQEAQINELRGRAQKNTMLAKLFGSLMGEGGDLSGLGGGDGGGNQDNLKAALLKGLTGIDVYTRSPEQQQALKIKGATQQAAEKANLSTGSANVVRESFQDIASLPEDYVSTGGHFNMLKDILASKFGDKEARERLVKAATAFKVVPEYASAQLAALSTAKPGVTATQHQREAIMQGWPHYASNIIQNLPGDIQKEAEKRHNEAVRSIGQKRSQYYKSSTNGKQDSSASKKFSWSDITHTAKQRGITENEVIDKLAKRNGMTVDQFMNLVERER